MDAKERTFTDVGSMWLHQALNLPNTGSPFPWQENLLVRMCDGEIPEAIDIPTGLGKTAVMAVWLVASACGAKMPRRLVYVDGGSHGE